MATLFELQEERAGIYEKMKALNDKAQAENRDLSAEEQGQWERMEAELDGVGERIAAHQKQRQRADRLKNLGDELATTQTQPTRPGNSRPNDDGSALCNDIATAWEREIAGGATRREALKQIASKLSQGDHAEIRRMAFRQWIRNGAVSSDLRNHAALQMDVDASGGTMVPTQEFIARLIIGLDERVFMRRLGTVLPLTDSESVGIPSLEADPADADWTSELKVGDEDSTMASGKRELRPHPLGKYLKVSKTLLRRSALPVDQLVRQRLEFKFAVTEEKAFLTGSGANQPLGVFTASNDGIDTSRDVSTDNTTTEITADGLINAKYALASQYLASGNIRWIFHRDAVKAIRKLKDGNGQYLWSAGLSGSPDTILEVPYEMSEFAPNTFTTGLYVGLIGDLQWYWIAESLMFMLERLREHSALTNQDIFVARQELDAMPVLAEAFSRVTLA